MDDEQFVLREIEKIFKNVLENKTIVVTMESSSAHVTQWNSLNNLLLINETESRLKVTFSIDFLFYKNSLKHSIANIICKPTPSSFEKLLHRRFKDERYRIERLIDYFLEKEIRTSFYFLSLKDTDTAFIIT